VIGAGRVGVPGLGGGALSLWSLRLLRGERGAERNGENHDHASLSHAAIISRASGGGPSLRYNEIKPKGAAGEWMTEKSQTAGLLSMLAALLVPS
jgi:hypothetical protein